MTTKRTFTTASKRAQIEGARKGGLKAAIRKLPKAERVRRASNAARAQWAMLSDAEVAARIAKLNAARAKAKANRDRLLARLLRDHGR